MIKLLMSLIFGLLASKSVLAFSLIKADDSICVQKLVPASGMPAGIVNDVLETGVFVKTCDGVYASVSFKNNKISINNAKGRIPSRLLKGQKDGLLDSEVSSSKAIKAAWLTGSTDRYQHAVLGDAIEASGFSVITRSGKRFDYKLDENSVFEDRKVRIADLDGDGQEEFILVRSYLNSGGALAVYGIRNNRLGLLDETPSIGTPNRWLNPAVVADVDNDGKIEIAYVETPHIGGSLHVLNFEKGKLVYKYKERFTSNHAIGSRVQELSVAADWNADGVPEILVPDGSRSKMKVISYVGKEPNLLASVELGGSVSTAVVAADLDRDKKPEVYFAFQNGNFLVLKP